MISNEDLNTFNQDVVRLCEATTNLHAEISGQKARLESKVKAAQANAEEAKQHTTSANDSRNSAMNAEISAHGYASRAEIAAERAEKASGLDTVSEAVSQALGDANINIPSEFDLKLEMEQNRALFAASSFVEWGKHKGYATVNQGITTYEASQYWVDAFASGNPDGTGVSNTVHPVVHVAGYTANIVGAFRTDEINSFVLPPAPDGCSVFDTSGSCRGSNKSTLNLKTDIDPKYGDVADSHDEAVERAFEGVSKNTNLRMGLEYWRPSNSTSTLTSIGDGTLEIQFSTAWSGAYIPVLTESNKQYEICFEIVDAGGDIGHGISLRGFTDLSPSDGGDDQGSWYYPRKAGVYTCRFTSTESTSTHMRFIANSNQEAGKAHFKLHYIRPVSEEVVTSRKDLVGLEFWLEEITPSNPMVFLCGSVQARMGHINGVIAEECTHRPPSYFSAFEGQADFVGRGVNWFTATEQEKRDILSSPRINIYRLNDGRLVQLRWRCRSFAGMGNGSFIGHNPAIHGSLNYAGTAVKGAIKPQGQRDDNGAYTGTSPYFYGATSTQHANLYPYESGVFCSAQYSGGEGSLDNGLSADGRVYFLPVAIVQRLNQGVHHPTLNPLGTATATAPTEINQYHVCTDYAQLMQALPHYTTKDCFMEGNVYGVDVTFKPGRYKGTGSLTETSNYNRIRPDYYKYHDSIYAGLIHDLRLSAHKQDVNKLRDEAARMAMSGVLRGQGSPYFTQVSEPDFVGSGSHSNAYSLVRVFDSGSVIVYCDTTKYPAAKIGDHIDVINNTTGEQVSGDIVAITSGSYFVLNNTTTAGNSTKWRESGSAFIPCYIVFGFKLPAMFENIPWVDLIGSPENIKQTFPNGIVGKWINQIPNGNGDQFFELNEKMISEHGARATTLDQGDTWTFRTGTNIDAANNGRTLGADNTPGTVQVFMYQAASCFTEPVSQVPLIGGVKSVLSSSNAGVSYGCRLQRSLIGKVGKGNSAYLLGESNIKSCVYNSRNGLYPHSGLYPKHEPLHVFSVGNSNGSSGFKAMPCLVQISKQLFIQFLGNELTHSPDEVENDKWGDTRKSTDFEGAHGLVPVVSGEGTKTDLNGNVVKTFCHRSLYPIGWANESDLGVVNL
ncbi:hypothetical protein FRN31_22170 [Vibrio alginolyticus]|nr:hypothetical protein [Vibrio alginolyticus]